MSCHRDQGNEAEVLARESGTETWQLMMSQSYDTIEMLLIEIIVLFFSMIRNTIMQPTYPFEFAIFLMLI